MKIHGIELKDAGKENKVVKNSDAPTTVSPDPPKKTYPRIESWGAELPGADELESDKTYLMVSKVECTRTEVTDEGGKKKYNASLNILACGFKPFKKGSIDDMSEKEVDDAIEGKTEVAED